MLLLHLIWRWTNVATEQAASQPSLNLSQPALSILVLLDLLSALSSKAILRSAASFSLFNLLSRAFSSVCIFSFRACLSAISLFLVFVCVSLLISRLNLLISCLDEVK